MKPDRRRHSVRLAAVVGLAAVALGACTSDPSPRRVAQDLVKTVTSDPVVEECMLGVIDEYDLNELGKDALSDNADTKAAAEAELDEYGADLDACNTPD